MSVARWADRRTVALTFIGSLALCATLFSAGPVSAGSPTACRVRNLDSGITKAGLQNAADTARKGHRLTVRGTCRGITILRKDLTISGTRTPGFGKPTLVGPAGARVLVVRARATVTIIGLTVRGGTAMKGGGIRNQGVLTLRDVIVRDNAAEVGGGVVNDKIRAVLTLRGSSSIRDNVATISGAGMYNRGTLRVRDSSSIDDNAAGETGGGIHNGNLATLKLSGSSSVRGNVASIDGGGLYNSGAVIMRGTSSIRRNSAANGGGVSNPYGNLTMRGASTVRRNSATRGGGVDNSFVGALTMKDASSIHLNIAGLEGGGVRGGIHVGVVCPPASDPNVHDNTPDDCWAQP